MFLQVDAIHNEREVLESEIKSAGGDMKSVFLSVLAKEGSINEPGISTETLGRVYGPLQKQLMDSLQRQEALVADIKVFFSVFAG